MNDCRCLGVDGLWLIRRAAARRGQPLRWSYDAECARGISYHGYGFDELLRILLLRHAHMQCPQCGAGDCTHEAARIVVAEIARAEDEVSDE